MWVKGHRVGSHRRADVWWKEEPCFSGATHPPSAAELKRCLQSPGPPPLSLDDSQRSASENLASLLSGTLKGGTFKLGDDRSEIVKVWEPYFLLLALEAKGNCSLKGFEGSHQPLRWI